MVNNSKVIMENNVSLYSRLRPAQTNHKRVCGFLALPGELRNQIYQHYFIRPPRCEIVAQGSDLEFGKNRLCEEDRTVKLWTGQLQSDEHIYKYTSQPREAPVEVLRVSRRLGFYDAVNALRTDWSKSFSALTLVCKQIYAETQVLLYERTQFVFAAPKRIAQFLAAVDKPQLDLIRSLELHYTTYGNPKFACDVLWKGKHYASWQRACSTIARAMKGLRELKIFINMSDDRVLCSLRQDWLQPLLQLRRLSSPRDLLQSSDSRKPVLSVVNINLLTRHRCKEWNGNVDLMRANEHLHRLFARAISLAILGASANEAMKDFYHAWNVTYHQWQFHLGFAKTGW